VSGLPRALKAAAGVATAAAARDARSPASAVRGSRASSASPPRRCCDGGYARPVAGVSVLLVSPAGTGGWQTNEAGLTRRFEREGVETQVRRVELGRFERLRHLGRTGSLLVAAASRRALTRALRGASPEP